MSLSSKRPRSSPWPTNIVVDDSPPARLTLRSLSDEIDKLKVDVKGIKSTVVKNFARVCKRTPFQFFPTSFFYVRVNEQPILYLSRADRTGEAPVPQAAQAARRWVEARKRFELRLPTTLPIMILG